MTLGPTRWHVIAESNFAWEREALDWPRGHLPDRDPWHVWTNFEFIDDAGKVSEVDALVLSPAGLFLVEIKSRPGSLAGDAHSWTWTTDGRSNTYDNPLILANRKAKRLASSRCAAADRPTSPPVLIPRPVNSVICNLRFCCSPVRCPPEPASTPRAIRRPDYAA